MAVGKDSVKRAATKTKAAEVKPVIENNEVVVPIAELKFKEVKSCSAVKKSIQEVGVILPVIAVKTADGLKVIDGAKRLTALKSLGINSVKAVVVDKDEKKVKRALKATEVCEEKCAENCGKQIAEKTDEIREAKFEAVRRVVELPTYLL